jgi:hypothetical protein
MKFSLFRSFGLILLAMLPLASNAQLNAAEFDLKHTRKPYHFGIALGYNVSDFKIRHAESFLNHDSINVVQSSTGPGFNLGIVSNLRMGKHFDLRLIPSLVFAEKRLDYQLIENGETSKTIESIFLSFPMLVKYKSDPYKDFRMYVIGGAKYTYDLASNAKARNAEDQVKVLRHDISAELGFGMEFYFPYFIFSPEVRFSHGLRDVHSLDPNLQFSDVLGRLLSRAITFTLHFEG